MKTRLFHLFGATATGHCVTSACLVRLQTNQKHDGDVLPRLMLFIVTALCFDQPANLDFDWKGALFGHEIGPNHARIVPHRIGLGTRRFDTGTSKMPLLHTGHICTPLLW